MIEKYKEILSQFPKIQFIDGYYTVVANSQTFKAKNKKQFVDILDEILISFLYDGYFKGSVITRVFSSLKYNHYRIFLPSVKDVTFEFCRYYGFNYDTNQGSLKIRSGMGDILYSKFKEGKVERVR